MSFDFLLGFMKLGDGIALAAVAISFLMCCIAVGTIAYKAGGESMQQKEMYKLLHSLVTKIEDLDQRMSEIEKKN